jgi:hypothetical protein
MKLVACDHHRHAAEILAILNEVTARPDSKMTTDLQSRRTAS